MMSLYITLLVLMIIGFLLLDFYHTELAYRKRRDKQLFNLDQMEKGVEAAKKKWEQFKDKQKES